MKHLYTSIFTLALLAISSPIFAQGPNDSGTYYQAADGKKGAELKTALCGIIYNRTERGSADNVYKMLWTDFQTTDVRSDGKVWDMYSNITNFTFVTDQDTGSHNTEGKAYNREHSFPKSWFGGKVMPMYADLFHLYPTDGKVNENRGDLPFGAKTILFAHGNPNSASDVPKGTYVKLENEGINSGFFSLLMHGMNFIKSLFRKVPKECDFREKIKICEELSGYGGTIAEIFSKMADGELEMGAKDFAKKTGIDIDENINVRLGRELILTEKDIEGNG